MMGGEREKKGKEEREREREREREEKGYNEERRTTEATLTSLEARLAWVAPKYHPLVLLGTLSKGLRNEVICTTE